MIQPARDFQFVPTLSANQVSWSVPATLAYFDGHFPENPVLPAVAILDVSLHFLRRLLDNPQLQIEKIHSSKFMSPVLPDMMVNLSAKQVGPHHWQMDWHHKDTCLAKIDLLLRA